MILEGERREIGLISLRGTAQKVDAAPYYMRGALQRFVGETAHIGERHRVTCLGARVARWSGRVNEEVYLRRVQRELERAPRDLLFGLYASSTVAMLGPTDSKVVYVTDGPAHELVYSYPQFEGLSAAEVSRLLRDEEAAVARADLVVTHTHWSKTALIERAGAAPEKVLVAQPGVPKERLTGGLNPKGIQRGEPLVALFVGRAWERKGLPEAMKAVELLNARGVPAQLKVFGCTPPEGALTEHATCFGPFDPNNDAELDRFEGHLREAHVHLLASKAECFGNSIAEAGAQGTPSIVTAVQGLPEAVIDGQTGAVVSADGDVAGSLAEVMSEWYADPELHLSLCRGVLQDVKERLNWDAWGMAVASALEAKGL